MVRSLNKKKALFPKKKETVHNLQCFSVFEHDIYIQAACFRFGLAPTIELVMLYLLVILKLHQIFV